MAETKVKYIKKIVKFGNQELTLWSIDGTTWSTRRSELAAIKERQESQRITLSEIKNEVMSSQAESKNPADAESSDSGGVDEEPIEIDAEDYEDSEPDAAAESEDEGDGSTRPAARGQRAKGKAKKAVTAPPFVKQGHKATKAKPTAASPLNRKKTAVKVEAAKNRSVSAIKGVSSVSKTSKLEGKKAKPAAAKKVIVPRRAKAKSSLKLKKKAA